MVAATVVVIVKKCERKHSSLNHYKNSNMGNLLLLLSLLGEPRPGEVKELAQGHTCPMAKTGVQANHFVYNTSCLRLSNHGCHPVLKTPTVMT